MQQAPFPAHTSATPRVQLHMHTHATSSFSYTYFCYTSCQLLMHSHATSPFSCAYFYYTLCTTAHAYPCNKPLFLCILLLHLVYNCSCIPMQQTPCPVHTSVTQVQTLYKHASLANPLIYTCAFVSVSNDTFQTDTHKYIQQRAMYECKHSCQCICGKQRNVNSRHNRRPCACSAWVYVTPPA